MAKIENYNGSVSLIAGITQKGGGDFALVEANAVQTREDGTRLDTELGTINDSINTLIDTKLELKTGYHNEIDTYFKQGLYLIKYGGNKPIMNFQPYYLLVTHKFGDVQFRLSPSDHGHPVQYLFDGNTIRTREVIEGYAIGIPPEWSEWVEYATKSDISNKVDKETGKGLSTNDYDNTAKKKSDAFPTCTVSQMNHTVGEIPINDGMYFVTDMNPAGYVIQYSYTAGMLMYLTYIQIRITSSGIYFRKGDDMQSAVWTKLDLRESEKVYNKVTELSENSTDEQYPSALAVYNADNALVLADERLKYYGDKDIVPSPENYFTVNETGETITGLKDEGKTQTELVIPYKINGVEITNLYSGNNGTSILNGATDKITKVVIPNSVTTIGYSAFENCTSLTSINIPNSITSIGSLAFENCSSLTSINIPDSVTSIIGNGVFSGCIGLTSINIPNSVTSINITAFYGCTNLTIYCEQGSYAETYAKKNNFPVVYTDVKATAINPIVKAALEEITTVNTIYDLGVQTELVITLPSGQVGDFIQVDFISGSTATTLTVNSSSGLVGFDLIPGTNTIYTLYFDWGVTGYDGTEVTYGWRFNYSEYSVDVV